HPPRGLDDRHRRRHDEARRPAGGAGAGHRTLIAGNTREGGRGPWHSERGMPRWPARPLPGILARETRGGPPARRFARARLPGTRHPASMLIAHLADLHLGYRAYARLAAGGINARERDVALAFRAALDRIIELRADLVLVAGDVFHTVRPSNAAIT